MTRLALLAAVCRIVVTAENAGPHGDRMIAAGAIGGGLGVARYVVP